jgi:glycosyltransferase involved in cell wall biosynthesis
MNILATGMGWIDHTPGGLNRYFADYTKAMTANGHDVEAYITAHGEDTTAPAYVKDVLQRPQRLSTLARTRAFRSSMKTELLRNPPDVFNPHFALYSSLVTRDMVPAHIPIVTHFHGPWAQESMVEDAGLDWGQKVRYQIKKNVELLSYRRSDHFIVLSQYFKNILVKDYGMDAEAVHVIPGAADVERFRPAEDRVLLRRELGLHEGQKVLFCARRLVNRMGIDNLIKAMAAVAKVEPDAVLYIAGDGSLRRQLEALVEELGLGGTVHLLGRVSNEDLVRWYQAADLSIVPTVTLEGFGLVTVEALACGTPVLGTPYGGTKEILGNLSPELLFESHKTDALARKIVAVLEGACILPSRRACREFVLSRYTWERAADSITAVFQQAIDERKGSDGYERRIL